MNSKLIRTWLKAQPDGATAAEIALALDGQSPLITRALRDMPDAFIDRWTKVDTYWSAVWMVVEVPENCPKPEPKRKATA